MGQQELGILLTMALAGTAANAQQPLPAEAFARLPQIEAPELSPNGSRIAYLSSDAQGGHLVVRKLEDFSIAAVVSSGGVKLRNLRWVGDEIIVVTVGDATSLIGVTGKFEIMAPFSVELSEGEARAHFLASRGYVVLQPQFRGSDGFGIAWRNAGRGEWGTGVMQNDVSDGVAALVAEGLADPGRVCIVGISYGGYAALAGAAFTPDLYACAAAVAPVTDLGGLLDYHRDRSGGRSSVVEYIERVFGGADRGRLGSMSPARNADQIRAPILLIHGRDDSVVPISQSREMEDPLKDAGANVELIELREEDHWLSRAETRLETLEALDRFLAEHLQN